MKRLKIAFVLDSTLDVPDGVQQYVLSLGRWLSRTGHEVHYIVGETERTDVDNVHSVARNINVTFNGNGISIPLWAQRAAVRKLLANEQFDILHVQSPYHPFMAQYILRESKGSALVSTFHILPYGRIPALANKFLGLMLKPSLPLIDVHLSVSGAAARFQEQTFGIKSTVLPNVFDRMRFMSAEPILPPTDKTTILFLGRLVERKGCQHLLRAIAVLDTDTKAKLRVIICGKGPLLPSLQHFVTEHQLEQIVEFKGFVSEEDKPGYFASADISVFPSTAGESFGIVLLEAMASGISAVLAGNNPGYSSVMEPMPELLFDPKNTKTFAGLLKEFIDNQAKRQQAASWGKAHVQQYDVEVVGPKLVDIYSGAIAKQSKQLHNKA